MASDNRSRNLGFFFDAALREVPDKVAIIDLFGGRERQVTYRDLDARMDRVAAMLAGLGAKPGERVGMLVGNRVEFLELFFGAMRMGAIPVILNTRLAADTLREIFRDAGCRIAVIEPACNSDAIAIAKNLPLAHRVARGRAEQDARLRHARRPGLQVSAVLLEQRLSSDPDRDPLSQCHVERAAMDREPAQQHLSRGA